MAKKKKKKSLSFQALERVGKNWSKASLTREALLQHVKGFARFVEKRYGLEQLENLKPGHVAAYVADMQKQNLSPGTMANRLSAVRQLAAAIGKANIVHRTNAEYGINRVRNNPVIADRDGIEQIKAALAERAQQGDRVAMMTYAATLLRDAFGLRAKESILSSWLIMHEGRLYLRIEGAKGGRVRNLEVKTPEQLNAAHQIDAMATALGSGTGRIIPPEMSLKEAYDAQRSLWSELGGNRQDRTHMHAQRHDLLQRMHKAGATNKEIMKVAGHGEDRSTGAYIPKA